MRVKALSAAALLLSAIAVPLRAQEPRPARLRASAVAASEGIALSFAWRYAPGDGPGREAPSHDDSGWRPVAPEMGEGAMPSDWSGVGWFRRHLVVEPALQHRDVALRFEGPGAAEVHLDGKLVLRTGGEAARPELPSLRREAVLVRLEGPTHLLAVRYAFPAGARVPGQGIGFRLSFVEPGRAEPAEDDPGWRKGLRGALVALPAFLAFLHFALWRAHPRARENLFYAVEMGAFVLIVLREYRDDLVPTEAWRDLLGRFGQGAPAVAILFGLLTYYAVRTSPFPWTWRPFAAASVVLVVATFAWQPVADYHWMPLFAAVAAEVFRVERSGRTVERRGAGIFLAGFAVFGLTVVLQVLIVTGVLESVAGTRAVYIVGIVASAVGMSLYLGRSWGAAENERKGRELARARELQLSMLPRVLPVVPGLEVAAATHTATEVGGDFYDLRPEGGGLLVAFGDATGHGLAAGIVVTAAKALFTSLPAGAPLPELLASCGRVLTEMDLPRLRMCLALARVSPREAAVVSAAMPPLLLHRAATGEVEELGSGGLPLGGRLAGGSGERRADLAPGDTVLFASDGFAELRTAAGEELGYGGAAATFRQAASAASARGVVEALGAELARLRGGRPLEDDVTFVVIRVAESAPTGGASGAGAGR
jgi:hypothetical protein